MPNTTATVYGFANRSASSITLEANESTHPHRGLLPFELHGAFHDPTLVLHVKFRLYNGHGYVYTTAIPDEVRPVRLTLHKGDESAYQAACAHL
jgi:hypothetical protein